MKRYIIKKYYNKPGKIEYVDAKENNLFEVMSEAEKMYTNEVWLVVILEKVGKSKHKDNITVSFYVERLEYRSTWYIVSSERLYNVFEDNNLGIVHYFLMTP